MPSTQSRSLSLSLSLSLLIESALVGLALSSVAVNHARADEPLGPLFTIPSLPDPAPFVPPDDSDPLPPDVFFSLFPGIELPTSPYTTPDLDGDGQQDVIAPLIAFDPAAPGVGSVKIFSGWTGRDLYQITSNDLNDLFGYITTGVPDLTGDNAAELLVSAPASSAGGQFAGRVYLYSGKTGAPLVTFTGSEPDGSFGLAAASIGDLDGDGLPEIAVAAPFVGSGRVYLFLSTAFVLPGGVFVQNLAASDASVTLTGEAAGDLFGFSVANAGDTNGDGYDDLLVGAPGHDAGAADTANPGKAYLYSGFDGTLLGSITGASVGDLLGYSVAPAGDIDSDGLADIILGAPGDPALFDRGRAYVFHAASLFNAGAPFAPRSIADADITFSAAVGGSATAGDTLFGLFVTLGNDSGADGSSGFDGVRDIVVHAGVRDDAGATIGTRGYVFSGADGSFLFSFTAGDAAPPDDPNDDPGGDEDQLTPFDGLGGAALIETIINNMGMEGATPAHGDLDATTVVTIDDLLIAIETIATGEAPAGAAAATQGEEDCLEIDPGVFDENGDPVMRPCEDPDDTPGGGPRPDPFDDQFNDDGEWDPCWNLREAIQQIKDNPQSEADCRFLASCRAADFVKDAMNSAINDKRQAEQSFNEAIAAANEAWNMPPALNQRSEREKAEVKRATALRRAGRNKIIATVGTTASGIGAMAACASIAFVTGPLLPLTMLACAAATVTTTVIAAGGDFNYIDAVSDAREEYRTNPARMAYETAVATAETNRFNTCLSVRQALSILNIQMNSRYVQELEDCRVRIGFQP